MSSPSSLLPTFAPAPNQRIARWIADGVRDGNMNSYGDEPDSMYTGGNPLFDEATGELRSLVGYLHSQHLERPWNAACFDPASIEVVTLEVLDQPWHGQDRYTLLSETVSDLLGDEASHSDSPAPAPQVSSAEQEYSLEKDEERAAREAVKIALGLVALGIGMAIILAIVVIRRRTAGGARWEEQHDVVRTSWETQPADLRVAPEGVEEKGEYEKVNLVSGQSLKATV